MHITLGNRLYANLLPAVGHEMARVIGKKLDKKLADLLSEGGEGMDNAELLDWLASEHIDVETPLREAFSVAVKCKATCMVTGTAEDHTMRQIKHRNRHIDRIKQRQRRAAAETESAADLNAAVSSRPFARLLSGGNEDRPNGRNIKR